MVTALLVSHGGARWLPAVLEGLASQSRAPDRVVAVDTGSDDASPALLAEAAVVGQVLAAPPGSTFGEAVTLGLAATDEAGDEEWIWLLHDDANPAPDALERLLEAPHLGVGPQAVMDLLRDRSRLPQRRQGMAALRRACRRLGLVVPR